MKRNKHLNISVCVEWMYTLYKFHFLNGISEINQLFDDILIIWPAPVYWLYNHNHMMLLLSSSIFYFLAN